MNFVECKFDDVTERDMDRLFAEEFACSPYFLSLFLVKLKVQNADVVSVELSKTDVQYGESDMTVIYSCGDTVKALLVEDKIDAEAMPNQSGRYLERGKIGIANGEYSAFDVFIVAPEEYLTSNDEAKRYPYRISYEEIAAYFISKSDARSQFKYQQIMQAINKQKTGYQVIENPAVTDFWTCYITYLQQHHPEFDLASKAGKRGSNATWPRFRTKIRNLYILHKMEFGYVDLTFIGTADRIYELEDMLEGMLGNLSSQGLTVNKTKKSCALRIEVPKLDVKKSYESQIDETLQCFNGISRMHDILKRLDMKPIRRLLESCNSIED